MRRTEEHLRAREREREARDIARQVLTYARSGTAAGQARAFL